MPHSCHYRSYLTLLVYIELAHLLIHVSEYGQYKCQSPTKLIIFYENMFLNYFRKILIIRFAKTFGLKLTVRGVSLHRRTETVMTKHNVLLHKSSQRFIESHRNVGNHRFMAQIVSASVSIQAFLWRIFTRNTKVSDME